MMMMEEEKKKKQEEEKKEEEEEEDKIAIFINEYLSMTKLRLFIASIGTH